MKINIVYLLLIALLGITVSASIAQQNQNVPKTDTEVEKLKIQLQTVENEKIGLETKLAEAQAKHAAAYAKLIETEFDKLKLELKDSNEKWLLRWIGFLGVMFAVIGVVIWSRLTKKMDDLIATEVEKRINRFQETVEQVDTLTNELNEAVGKVKIQQGQIRILEKEHAVSVLNVHMGGRFNDENPYPEQINILPESALLDIFNDETYYLGFRCWAAEVLASKESTLLVSPLLEFLNSAVDSDEYNETYVSTKRDLRRLASFLCVIHTQETYEGLNKFLNRLLTENPRHKDLFLTLDSIFTCLCW